MHFTADEKLLAMATAYRVLVVSLVDSKSLDIDIFSEHCDRAVSRMAAIDEDGASAALAELLEPLVSDLRRHRQRTDGS